MTFDFQSTPLQSSGSVAPLIGDLSLLYSDEMFPLDCSYTQTLEDTVTVHRNVIRTYQHLIFHLQRQVCYYEMILNQLVRKHEVTPEPVELSSPLNEASIKLVNSILRARIPNESILRAYDDEEV